MKPAEAPRAGFRLAFVQLGCPSYKREMFEKLSSIPGVDLDLYIGDKSPAGHAPNGDIDDLPHQPLKNTIIRLFSFQLVWQSVNKHLSPREYDLILLPEGVLYLSNYLLICRSKIAGVPIGFYSHGFNYQRQHSWCSSLLEKLRRIVHRHADLIITYSQSGADFIQDANPVMAGKVFVAKNTLDVAAINAMIEQLGEASRPNIRRSLGFQPDDVVLAFTGRISAEKNPDYVITAIERLRQEGLPVRSIFIGDGPALADLEQRLNNAAEDTRQSIRMIGRIPASDVSAYLNAADISVMPGMTGLAIVHSFAAALPYITIKSAFHSPEIEYLNPGVNGLITDADVESFTAGVRELVCNRELRKNMGAAAREFSLRELGIERQMEGFLKAITYTKQLRKKVLLQQD